MADHPVEIPELPAEHQIDRLVAVYGIENLPDDGSLLVGNHTIYGFMDLPFMVAEIWKRRGMTVRGLGYAVNGALVEQASTETELEHPARAVAWLANTLAEREVALEAGHIVLSGARGGAVRVSAGDGIGASLGNLGSVRLQLVR